MTLASKPCSSESVVDEIMKVFLSGVLNKLSSISDESKRYLYFIAWLNSELEKRSLGRIIITGGFAVELYTARIYRTMDVDIIAEGSSAALVVEEFLKKFSEAIGRGYLPRYEILQLKSIDIVSTTYRSSVEPTKVLVNGYVAYLEPVEELIVKYLAGWKLHDSTEDRDKALWLYMVWKEKVDREYLAKRAKEEGVLDYLEKLDEALSSEETTGLHT